MYVISYLLNGCKNAEILEIFLENYDDDLTVDELTRMADVPRGHIYDYTRFLVEKGIITKTKAKRSKAFLFRLNKENKISKVLMILEHEITSSGLKKKIAEMKE